LQPAGQALPDNGAVGLSSPTIFWIATAPAELHAVFALNGYGYAFHPLLTPCNDGIVVVLNCLEILLAQNCRSLASGCIRFGFR